MCTDRLCKERERVLGLLWPRRMPLTAWWSVMGGGTVSDSVTLTLPSKVLIAVQLVPTVLLLIHTSTSWRKY